MGTLVQSIFAIVVAVVGYVVYDYYTILSLPSLFENFQQSDLTSCKRLSAAKGCEDLVLDSDLGIAILGCPTPFGVFAKGYVKSGTQKSNFFAYNLKTQTLAPLQLKGYPESKDLSVHGMDLIPKTKDQNGIDFLVINHHNDGTDSVESFHYELDEPSLTHVQTFQNEGFHSLNGIAAVDKTSFYYTQYVSKSNKIFNTLELAGAIRGGKVFHYDGKGDVLTQATSRTYKQPNGIAFNLARDQILVGETVTGKLYFYDINDDSTLDLTDTLQLSVLPDNLKLDKFSGDFYVAGFPIGFEVYSALQTFNTPQFKPCRSSIIKVSKELGEAKFFGTKYKFEPVLMDDGNSIFSTSVGAFHNGTNSILVSGFLNEKGALHCPLKN